MGGEEKSVQDLSMDLQNNLSGSAAADGTASHYDLIIIGSGQCGNPLAAAFHDNGKRVVVIERDAVGGTCVNYGCTPTKAMVASGEVASLAARAGEFGIVAGAVKTNLKEVVDRKRGIVDASRKSSEKKYKDGISLLRGTGSFVGPKQVRVKLNDGGEQDVTADLVVIDTGLSTMVPRIDGLDGVHYLDNASIMELERLPEHLIVLGGGYVGLEFAQMFRRFGSRVTIIHDKGQLLTQEDEDVAEEIAKILREDGIEILLNAQAKAAHGRDAEIALTVLVDGVEQTIKGSDLLLAAGRKPNTKDLNLGAAGVAMDEHGFVDVNEKLETSVKGIFAVGDVKGGPAFTHISYDDYRVLKANLLDGGDRVITGRPVPYCVFIDPQLGRIGMNENQAKKAGLSYKVARAEMSHVARAYETGQTRGFMKALIDAETGEILGAAILGADGGETMAMLQIAMMGKLPYQTLRDGIFAHPTYAESLNILFASIK